MSNQRLWPYQLLGHRNNPPLLFLHGFLGSGSDWLPIATLLANRFFCILPDLPGHGLNMNRPLPEPLTFDILAAELSQLLDYLGLERANLTGYSMGGRVALYAATQFPVKINMLVLEGTNPGIANAQERQHRAELDDQRAARILAEGVDNFVDAWYKMELFASLRQHPQLLAETKIRRKQNNPQWAAKIISELSPGLQPPLWDKLDTLPMPVLLVAGALDEKYTSLAKEMAAHIPQATVKIAPNAGHNVHLEQPAYFADLLAAWVK